MAANYVRLRDPFRPTTDRDVGKIRAGVPIGQLLIDEQLIKDGKRTTPFVVCVDGQYILSKDWNLPVRDNQTVVVSHLPRGGGGSNPLQILATIAVIAASLIIPGAQVLALTGTAFAATAAAIQLGGTLLLGMLFGTSSANTGTTTSTKAAAAQYSLAASGNTSKLMDVIPTLYGRMKFSPNYASEPFTEIQNGDQYLYQLFCLSQGYVNIEQILVGDTDISSYPEVQYQIVQPNQPLTLFPSDVDTSTEVASQTLYGVDQPEFAVLGPFVANDAGSVANYLAVDVSLPGGAYHVSDNGGFENITVAFWFEYQQVDNNGNAIGDWQTLTIQSLNFSTNDPQRFTYKVAVPAGRYQVRGQRTNNQGDNQRDIDVLYWDTLRAYIEAPQTFGAVTMLAVVMKATNSLSSSSSHDINVIATRQLETWDPVNGWTLTTTPTRSIAWAFADVLRDPNYGRNFPDSRYNLTELYRLDQVWAARGDTFNFIFDSQQTLWTCLTQIAKAGRAVPLYYAGLIDIVRNEPRSVPTAVFGPQNMVKGSFSTTYQFAQVDTPDYVQVQFTNEDTWAADTVDCILPGGTSETPAVVNLAGVTNKDQAWREGITQAAINVFQRRLIGFTTELEGLLPRFSDLTNIAHDVPGWGYTGRVMAFDTNTGVLTTSEDLVFTDNVQHVIALRKANGAADGPYNVSASPRGFANECVLDGNPSIWSQIYISDGVTREYTQYQFGPTDKAFIQGQLATASPDNTGKVALTFVNYAPEIFEAETGGILLPPSSPSNLPGTPSAPIVDNVSLQYTFVVGQQTIVASPANGAQYYEFQVSQDNINWIKLGTSVQPQIGCSLTPGTWYIRARAVGVIAGAWKTIIADVQATTLPLVSISSFMTTPAIFGVKLTWLVGATGGIADHVEIWVSQDQQLGNANLLGTFPPKTTTFTQDGMGPGETHYYWIRVVDTAGRDGPWYNGAVGIVGQSSSDTTAIIAQLGHDIGYSQLNADLQSTIDSGGGAATQIEQINNDLEAAVVLKSQYTTADGKVVAAGMAIGVTSDGQSQIILAADTFALIDGDNASNINSDDVQYPFIVQNGIVYINTAFIANGTINNAMIGNAQITTAKIAQAAITSALIADAQITQAKIADASIVTAHIQVANIDTLRIAGNAVTTMAAWGGITGNTSFGYTAYGGNLAVMFSATQIAALVQGDSGGDGGGGGTRSPRAAYLATPTGGTIALHGMDTSACQVVQIPAFTGFGTFNLTMDDQNNGPFTVVVLEAKR